MPDLLATVRAFIKCSNAKCVIFGSERGQQRAPVVGEGVGSCVARQQQKLLWHRLPGSWPDSPMTASAAMLGWLLPLPTAAMKLQVLKLPGQALSPTWSCALKLPLKVLELGLKVVLLRVQLQ